MMVKKVAILGAGNGGMTAAADLKEQGFEISLYELPQFGNNLKVMQEKARNFGFVLSFKAQQRLIMFL